MPFRNNNLVHKHFCSEFAFPDPSPSKEDHHERNARWFSTQTFAQIFVLYRITHLQVESAKTKRDDFELMSNMSFAVACCIVDAGFHGMLNLWPAALLTPERLAAAERACTETAGHKRSVSFDDFLYLGMLPFVLPCNRCSASLGPGKDQHCLACRKSGKTNHCSLEYCDDLNEDLEAPSEGASEPFEVEEESGDKDNEDGKDNDENDSEDEEEVAQSVARESAGPSADLLAGTVSLMRKRKTQGSSPPAPATKRRKTAEKAAATPKKTMSPMKKDDKKKSPVKKDDPKATSPAKKDDKKTTSPAKKDTKATPPAKKDESKSVPKKLSLKDSSRKNSVSFEQPEETPEVSSSALPREFSAAAASTLAAKMSTAAASARRTTMPPPAPPAAAAAEVCSRHTWSGPLELSRVQPPLSGMSGGIFMPGSPAATATFALNAATSSGATVEVHLADLEALVTFYESVSNLFGLTGVSRAGTRARSAVDRVRQSLDEHREAVTSRQPAHEQLESVERTLEQRRCELELTEKALAAAKRDAGSK
ncbi:hypothetical protein EXIGLDRAFT_707727 [Exidia glandulosa HHB12029]|uniref:Uncharacterized protein n=1 Tax=Exidia glandulosa HHB12029 TaxID=1314781 RepID=A0A165JQ54_EXIGL|nr:hypothetical protein EXIGLDRAFT_707727 [Exidia glandulosa HHB12029]